VEEWVKAAATKGERQPRQAVTNALDRLFVPCPSVGPEIGSPEGPYTRTLSDEVPAGQKARCSEVMCSRFQKTGDERDLP
jgi:hypothetical protein